jgi:hypothetical protein
MMNHTETKQVEKEESSARLTPPPILTHWKCTINRGGLSRLVRRLRR